MGHYKRDRDLTKAVIDKMLIHAGLDYESVIANPRINNIPWYQYYTWSQAESEAYKIWYIDFLRNSARPKFSKKEAERQYALFNLCFGLKIQEDENINC